MRPGKIAVTGATGYIGRALGVQAMAQGWQVRALSRTAPADVRIEFVPYALDLPLAADALKGVDAIVHLAADTTSGDERAFERDIEAARRLLQAVAGRSVRFVFVSSQTARADAPTFYGRGKHAIEQEVLAAGGIVVRPGLVYGREERGLFGTLCRAVRTLPVLPCFLPRPRVQPIHVDDLGRGILQACRDGDSGRIYCLGAAEPISFDRFLDMLARYRLSRFRLFLPVPLRAVVLLLRCARVVVGSAVDPGQLESLGELPGMACRPDLDRLGLALRPLAAGVHKSGNGSRAALIREAYALGCYVLRRPPAASLLRRYVRCIEATDDGYPLHLPARYIAFPPLVALLEAGGGAVSHHARLCRRLDTMTVIAEASTQGAERFIATRNSRVAALVGIAWACVAEVIWRGAAKMLQGRIVRTLRDMEAAGR